MPEQRRRLQIAVSELIETKPAAVEHTQPSVPCDERNDEVRLRAADRRSGNRDRGWVTTDIAHLLRRSNLECPAVHPQIRGIAVCHSRLRLAARCIHGDQPVLTFIDRVDVDGTDRYDRLQFL